MYESFIGLCLGNPVKPIRNKRAAYDLPSGVELLIGKVNPTFTCPGNGYYADVHNLCKLFHVCNIVELADGKKDTQQFTFSCGNQTVFNQLTFTCSNLEEAVSCKDSPNFYYLNQIIGQPEQPFLIDDDIQRAQYYLPIHQ
ncbi:uncharacterized protein LOC143232154 isoform X2 [Tachypleus tridentatus]|uniref:uncharacterized protein LOC143232154 isoform X2 n=1 Tax=Tachypleus tridentatus TaxID=6853 RepID=UPI003FD191B1